MIPGTINSFFKGMINRFGAIALDKCRKVLSMNAVDGFSAIDAIVAGINAVELDLREQYYVGIGGLPNAKGEMELDAAIMDHKSRFFHSKYKFSIFESIINRYGAVMSIKNCCSPIAVARTVLEKSPHNILCGDGALEWAEKNGFDAANILTEKSKLKWEEWLQVKAQQQTVLGVF